MLMIKAVLLWTLFICAENKSLHKIQKCCFRQSSFCFVHCTSLCLPLLTITVPSYLLCPFSCHHFKQPEDWKSLRHSSSVNNISWACFCVHGLGYNNSHTLSHGMEIFAHWFIFLISLKLLRVHWKQIVCIHAQEKGISLSH